MINLLAKNGFRLDIPDNGNTDTFQWQIQSAQIPSVTMEVASIARGPKYSKLSNNNIAGTGTSYDDLTIQFLVDENMITYAELYRWMMTMNNPTGPSNSDGCTPASMLLHVLDNNKDKVVATFRFMNPFPKSLGVVEFNYTEAGDVETVTCDVDFEYSYFEMISIVDEVATVITPQMN
ncbi:tail tube protein [Vibrio phage 1.081.O._10N.286.52.C2]|nr:tail tube protein [Vibrio phage 1.081.O._10N.286.52.C2]